MSGPLKDVVKRWTAKRKSALVIEIIQGKTTVAEASRSFDLSPSEIEGWVDDARRGMENALRANPLDVRQEYEKQLRDLRSRPMAKPCSNCVPEKVGGPHGAGGRQLIRTLHEGLLADGIKVSLAKLCAWFGVPRRTVYYKPTKAAPKIYLRFAKPIKAMIEENPSFGYRTVAFLLGFNKNTVQRIFQLQHWQVSKRPVGMRPRIQALPSVATAPNERWATDLCRIWAGKDGWTSLALVIDCHTREFLGWHLSRTGEATTAASALEHALISRFGTLCRVNREFLLRSDSGLVFTSRHYTALIRSYGLRQEFITPHCPQQNGMVERVIRTLKEQCVHRHRFESIQHAARAIGDWIQLL